MTTLFFWKLRIFFEVPELSSQNSTFIVKPAPSLAEGLDPPLKNVFIQGLNIINLSYCLSGTLVTSNNLMIISV